jgi:hypothetical protein
MITACYSTKYYKSKSDLPKSVAEYVGTWKRSENGVNILLTINKDYTFAFESPSVGFVGNWSAFKDKKIQLEAFIAKENQMIDKRIYLGAIIPHADKEYMEVLIVECIAAEYEELIGGKSIYSRVMKISE